MVNTNQTNTQIHDQIRWANRSMTTLHSITNRLSQSGTLRGKSIALSMPMTTKIAPLALALKQAGATVTLFDEEAGASLIHALKELDICVDTHIEHGIKGEFDIVFDTNSILKSDIRDSWMVRKQGYTKPIKLNKPNTLFHDIYGTGQTCVMGVLDVTNLQLAGRHVLVVGYDRVGQGVARHANAMGARVTVSDTCPINALQAFHDGHTVNSIANAASITEVVFACTDTITAQHLDLFKDKVILCTVGMGTLPMDHLHALPTPTEVRKDVVSYTLNNGKTALVVADGHPINTHTGEGVPLEITDIWLSLQTCTIEHLLTCDIDNDYPSIPESVYGAVAATYLQNKGGIVEQNCFKEKNPC